MTNYFPFSDEELITKAFMAAQEALGLDPMVTYQDKLEVIRLYDNLAKLFCGDEQQMRHWVGTGNRHLGCTPKLRVHEAYWVKQINDYLEWTRNRP